MARQNDTIRKHRIEMEIVADATETKKRRM